MSVKILIGDVRDKLRELPDESVHCVVTSPPYWGLRDYGSCDCGSGRFSLGQGEGTGGNMNYRPSQGFKPTCPKCSGTGRIKGTERQLGSEPTYQEHVTLMADVFDEVKRVLRKDGTLWLNYGDSYAGSSMTGGTSSFEGQAKREGRMFSRPSNLSGLKPKDLCGIPWRVAFALQDRGWYLRQDIIWAKPNPMPESVKDRCTKAHEYVFLLTKSPRYYFDAEAIAEEASLSTVERWGTTDPPRKNPSPQGLNVASVSGENTFGTTNGRRNKRSVWEIATAPYPDAHFATFPPELPTICIKAGTSEKGCCGKCGKPWVRETKLSDEYEAKKKAAYERRGGGGIRSSSQHNLGHFDFKTYEFLTKQVETLGWSPSCQCTGAAIVPATCLDPFSGAGTTGLVADRLQRNAILIELNPAYAELARKRIDGDAPLFSPMEAAE